MWRFLSCCLLAAPLAASSISGYTNPDAFKAATATGWWPHQKWASYFDFESDYYPMADFSLYSPWADHVAIGNNFLHLDNFSLEADRDHNPLTPEQFLPGDSLYITGPLPLCCRISAVAVGLWIGAGVAPPGAWSLGPGWNVTSATQEIPGFYFLGLTAHPGGYPIVLTAGPGATPFTIDNVTLLIQYPEPSTFLLFAGGIALLAALGRRRSWRVP